MNSDKTYVTKPYLPPLDEFMPYLEKIWGSGQLTNCGPFHQEFELALAKYLGVPHVSLFTNATIALVTALQSLRITGEVITTPYSFVATAHSLLWNGIKPVFVDIDPVTLNLDPAKIEAAITPQTTAILPVHCYGHPCDVEAIQKIADMYNLRVIYDAAHAFGVECHCGSVLNHGDLSILSFHATKVFNTFEGGAIICRDLKTKERIDYLKNFGFANETTVVATGINGKMSEFNAALGLLQLKHIDSAIFQRSIIDAQYRNALVNVSGIHCVSGRNEQKSNFAYFPILVEDSYPLSRDELFELLQEYNFHTRRYFYPLISEFPMYRALPSSNPKLLPHANFASDHIICLPIYSDLRIDKVNEIISIIRDNSHVGIKKVVA